MFSVGILFGSTQYTRLIAYELVPSLTVASGAGTQSRGCLEAFLNKCKRFGGPGRVWLLCQCFCSSRLLNEGSRVLQCARSLHSNYFRSACHGTHSESLNQSGDIVDNEETGTRTTDLTAMEMPLGVTVQTHRLSSTLRWGNRSMRQFTVPKARDELLVRLGKVS